MVDQVLGEELFVAGSPEEAGEWRRVLGSRCLRNAPHGEHPPPPRSAIATPDKSKAKAKGGSCFAKAGLYEQGSFPCRLLSLPSGSSAPGGVGALLRQGKLSKRTHGLVPVGTPCLNALV